MTYPGRLCPRGVRRGAWGLAIAATMLVAAPGARAVESEMNAVYGRGLHAFFANQTAQAEHYFTEVIESGSNDPLPYYFRAMTRMRWGRSYEAQQDLMLGAMFEARNPGAASNVGRALERVQGAHRQTLERYRREARLQHAANARELARARYEERSHRETEVLRQETPIDLGELAGDTVPADSPPAVELPADEPPVVEPPAVDPGDNSPAIPDDADPFGGDALGEPAVDDEAPTPQPELLEEPPFADAAAPSGAEAILETPADREGDEADPFGGPDSFDDAPSTDAPPADAGTGDDADASGFETLDSAPFDAAAPPAGSDAPSADDADVPADDSGGLLGRILGHTLSDLVPTLPAADQLPGLSSPETPSAEPETPDADSFDLGPADAPITEPGSPSDPFGDTPGADAEADAFGDADDAPASDDAVAAESDGAEADDDPFADIDPFGEAAEAEATPAAADGDQPAEADAAEQSARAAEDEDGIADEAGRDAEAGDAADDADAANAENEDPFSG